MTRTTYTKQQYLQKLERILPEDGIFFDEWKARIVTDDDGQQKSAGRLTIMWGDRKQVPPMSALEMLDTVLDEVLSYCEAMDCPECGECSLQKIKQMGEAWFSWSVNRQPEYAEVCKNAI